MKRSRSYCELWEIGDEEETKLGSFDTLQALLLFVGTTNYRNSQSLSYCLECLVVASQSISHLEVRVADTESWYVRQNRYLKSKG